MPETTLQHDPTRVRPYTPPVPRPTPLVKQDAIEWAPLAGPSRLPFIGTDYASVRKALIGMWGPFPIRLSKTNGDDEAMRAMLFASGPGSAPFHILHQALMQYGEIELRDL